MHRAVPFVVRGLRWHAPAAPSPPRRPERSGGPALARVDGARTCDRMSRHCGGRVVGGMSAARREREAAHRSGWWGRVVGMVGAVEAGRAGGDHARVPMTVPIRIGPPAGPHAALRPARTETAHTAARARTLKWQGFLWHNPSTHPTLSFPIALSRAAQPARRPPHFQMAKPEDGSRANLSVGYGRGVTVNRT